MQPAGKKRGPKTPFHERIRWTNAERSLLIDAWIEAIRADPARQLSPRDALVLAMSRTLPPERRRDIKSIPKRDYRWLTEGVQTRLAGAPEPVAPEDWSASEDEISPTGRIRWSAPEREAIIAAGVKVLRADPTGRMSFKQAMVRAQLIALPPERRRNLEGVPLAYQQWFRNGVEAGLTKPPTPEPKPEPEPARPPGPPVMVPGTGFTMPSVLVDEPAAEPEPTTRPGPGRTGPALPPIREPGPAPSPLRLDAESLPDPAPGAIAVGELDATGLIILGLSRLVAERNRIAQREAAVVAAVQELASQFETFKARILDRFEPIEQAADTTSKLLRTVLGSLDPALLREFEQSQPPAPVAPAARAEDPVEPEPLETARKGPGTVEPAQPAAPRRPLPRICVVGLRPAAESQIRNELRGLVAITSVLDNSHAIRHDYRQYDAVVITRHASHSTHTKILGQVPKDHVIRVRQTGVQSVTAAIRELDAQHALAWSSAVIPGPVPIPPQ